MSADTNTRTGTDAGARRRRGTPLAVPRRAVQRRTRPGLVGLAVALVAVGGLVAAYAVSAVGHTRLYLAVAHHVDVGAVIGNADLTTVRVSTDPGLRPIPAGDLTTVVGRYAAVELIPGTLLTNDEVTSTPVPGAGNSVVGLDLSKDRAPVGRIKPGSQITLVVTAPATLGQPDDTTSGPAQTFAGVVVDVADGAQQGGVHVNVTVAAGDAASVTALGAAGRLALYLGGRG
jgi:hypothetical protein